MFTCATQTGGKIDNITASSQNQDSDNNTRSRLSAIPLHKSKEENTKKAATGTSFIIFLAQSDSHQIAIFVWIERQL